MFIIYVLNLLDVRILDLTKDYIYGIYIYSLIRVKSYRKKYFCKFQKKYLHYIPYVL